MMKDAPSRLEVAISNRHDWTIAGDVDDSLLAGKRIVQFQPTHMWREDEKLRRKPR